MLELLMELFTTRLKELQWERELLKKERKRNSRLVEVRAPGIFLNL